MCRCIGAIDCNVSDFTNPEARRGFGFSEWSAAEERGRQMALAKLRVDPAARARVESVYGVAYCVARYPEVYRGLKEFAKFAS